MRKSLVSLLIALLFTSPLAHAQNTTAPLPQTSTNTDDDVLRINTNLVQTDVSVFDRKGKFVEGLQQSDFELKVDGKAQPLSFFERIASRGGDTAFAPTAANASANGDSTVTPVVEPSRTITFFVDDFHLTPQTIARSRAVLKDFIDKQMTPGTDGMIVAASGSVGFLAQPTSDKAALKAAAQRIKYQSRAALDIQKCELTEYQALAIDRGDRDVLAYVKQQFAYNNCGDENVVRSRARVVRRQAALLNRSVVENLEAVVRSRPASSTRQIVFFISSGFAIDNSEGDINYRLRRVTDQAARRNVVIYTLDARGLSVGNLDASTDAVSDIANINSTFSPNYNSLAEVSQSQEVLRTLAADTGGRALLNNNGLENLVANVINETSSYYLLGWRPEVIDERTNEPKFRRIEVGIKGRSDLKVRTRRGFFNRSLKNDANAVAANSAAPPTTPNAALNSALNAPNERPDIPVALYGIFTNDAASGSTVTAMVQVTSDGVNYGDASTSKTNANNNAVRQATVNLACVLLNEAGKAVYSDGRDVQLTQAAEAGQAENQSSGKLVTGFTAPVTKPGLYQFRVAARDALSGRIGTKFQWIEVPEIKPGALTLSSLIIAEKMRAQSAPAADTQATSDFTTTLDIDRTFRRAARLQLQVFIYNAAPNTSTRTPDVTMELQVTRAGKSVLNAPAHPVTLTDAKDISRIPYGAEIPLASLAPGLYTLQATATDRTSRKSVTQSSDFVVK